MSEINPCQFLHEILYKIIIGKRVSNDELEIIRFSYFIMAGQNNNESIRLMYRDLLNACINLHRSPKQFNVVWKRLIELYHQSYTEKVEFD